MIALRCSMKQAGGLLEERKVEESVAGMSIPKIVRLLKWRWYYYGGVYVPNEC